ncbi:MAG: Mur ligase [Leptothrix sp. (in: Bacteria)]|nr:Mur ligase [Leptothrix sp. (in: b-proteobacteria)]
MTALRAAARDDAALAAWAGRVRALCAALGWPEAQPLWRRHGACATPAFAAPEGALFTATAINEWAWERACADLRPPRTRRKLAPVGALAGCRGRARPAAAGRRRHGLDRRRHRQPLLAARRAAAGHGRALAGAARHPHRAVTGSNGKTTTRLLLAMAAAAGRVAGGCSTEGVLVGGRTVQGGDYAGPAGARAVLRHPAVQFAALETARGGILRRGLALRRAAVAVVTNVSADHLGEYGVAGVDDIAEAKLTVACALAAAGTAGPGQARARGGTLVLNAAGGLALFAPDHAHPALAAWRARGGSTCRVQAGRLLHARDGALRDLGPADHMPLTLAGAAGFNVKNIAAAVLAAAAGLPPETVRHTLANFGLRPQDNPGRLERHAHRGATVLQDYAHNPDGLAQLLAVARALRPRRLGLLLGQAGNRDDAALVDLAREAAAAKPDRIVLKELPLMLRGGPPGEVPARLLAGLHAAGVVPEHVTFEADEEAAARALLVWAGPGDVVVLPVHTAEVRERLVATLARE